MSSTKLQPKKISDCPEGSDYYLSTDHSIVESVNNYLTQEKEYSEGYYSHYLVDENNKIKNNIVVEKNSIQEYDSRDLSESKAEYDNYLKYGERFSSSEVDFFAEEFEGSSKKMTFLQKIKYFFKPVDKTKDFSNKLKFFINNYEKLDSEESKITYLLQNKDLLIKLGHVSYSKEKFLKKNTIFNIYMFSLVAPLCLIFFTFPVFFLYAVFLFYYFCMSFEQLKNMYSYFDIKESMGKDIEKEFIQMSQKIISSKNPDVVALISKYPALYKLNEDILNTYKDKAIDNKNALQQIMNNIEFLKGLKK